VPIRVLLVDDSAVVRGLMNKALTADPSILVGGSAANGSMAIDLAKEQQPDIIILDIEMPVMDGVTALPELQRVAPNAKIIMASSLTIRNAEISLKALSLGASDYIAKPTAKPGEGATDFYQELIAKIKALVPRSYTITANTPIVVAKPLQVEPPKVITPPPSAAVPLQQSGIKALAIASSTGGPQALLKLFEDIKGQLVHIPIFITQHMPPTFTTILADHISKAGERSCVEAKEGDIAQPGCAYLAPGDFHMVPAKHNGDVIIHINQNPPENFCRPAADPMLRALSEIYGRHLLVLVLTGMGQDGLEGCKVVVANGGNVIAQNEATSVVYGMPKAVAENNLCRAVLPLHEIGGYLAQHVGGK